MASFKLGRFTRGLLRFHFNKISSPYPEISALFHSSSLLNADGQPIKMPSLSPTMMEGTIVKWLKKEGDPIQPGDVICDIQTDKAVVSFEMEEEGILAKILVPEDTKDITIGTTIALMVEEGEDWKNVTIPASLDAPKADAPPPAQQQSSAPVATGATSPSSSASYGPSVRLLLEKYGLQFNDVPAGGPHGRLVKGDILRLINEKNLTPIPIKAVSPPAVGKTESSPSTPAKSSPNVTVGDGFDDIELTSMRKTIAKRLTQSKSTIAHSYMTLECNLDSVLDLRKRLKSEGVSVSVNDVIIKAVATALTRCPQVNSVWQGDQLVQLNNVDVSVAVATDSGLITPIVKNANELGLEEIASEVRDLASRAKIGKLKLDEFQGGSFTISNLGMFGISEFSAIINPPQCAILAVGGGLPILNCEGEIEHKMKAKLSYDRSAIDDDTAAEFMEILTSLLESPNTILLGSYQKAINHPLASLL